MAADPIRFAKDPKLRSRLKEDAQMLRAGGSHNHREIAGRIDAMLDGTADMDRLRKIEEKARAFFEAQSAYRGKTGVLGYGVEIDPASFEALFVAVEAPGS